MANLDRLLRCESEEEFHDEFDSLSNSWSAAYLDYYSDHINSEMPASVAQLDAHPTGDQEVAGSVPGSASFVDLFSWYRGVRIAIPGLGLVYLPYVF